jgi:hypothetical protein
MELLVVSSNGQKGPENSLEPFFYFYFYFLVGLGFELGFAKPAFYLLSHTSSLFCYSYFGDGGLTKYLPRMTSNHDPPDLSHPSS